MFSRHLIAAMEPLGFEIMYKFVALLFLFVSLSKGITIILKFSLYHYDHARKINGITSRFRPL